MKILVTGSSGFIGFHLTKRLIDLNHDVVGIDMMNNYYSVQLKKDRLNFLNKVSHNRKSFQFYKTNICNRKAVNEIFKNHNFDVVINLAAQAGVRDSILNPKQYLDYNINGFLNIIEESRLHNIKHLVYASTSSVYGLNEDTPYSVKRHADHPIQFYAVTKKTNELMAHTWSSLYDLPTTGLRFFTVYGPWGRPDMALYNFVHNINKGNKINVFNHGHHIRDFTYIDEIIDGIVLSIKNPPKKKNTINELTPDVSKVPYQLFNLGSGKIIKLSKFINIIEENLQKKAKINLLPMQPGDVESTRADISKTRKILGYNPKVFVKEGIEKFVEWYLSYYR